MCFLPFLLGAKYTPTCYEGLQAGAATLTLETAKAEMFIVSFPAEYCTPPSVVALGSENITQIRLGVVTPSIAIFLVSGEPGEVTFHWHAAPLTP